MKVQNELKIASAYYVCCVFNLGHIQTSAYQTDLLSIFMSYLKSNRKVAVFAAKSDNTNRMINHTL